MGSAGDLHLQSCLTWWAFHPGAAWLLCARVRPGWRGDGCPARGRAAGTQGTLGKKLLFLIILQQLKMLEPAVSWTEMASQHSRMDRMGCLLRVGFSHSIVRQWHKEGPLKTRLASNPRLLSQQSLLCVLGPWEATVLLLGQTVNFCVLEYVQG